MKRSLIAIAVFCGSLLVAPLLAGEGEGTVPGLYLKKWTGISGTAIADLTGKAAYPDSPNQVSRIATAEAPTNSGDNYGLRMEGYLVPAVSGTYRLAIASDDNGELYLSTGDTDADLQLIASVPAWTSPRQYTKYASQISQEVQLEAGVFYRLVALMKEGGGLDNLSVAWSGPDIPEWTVIPEANLALVADLDLTAPSTPAGLTVTERYPDAVKIQWNASTDDVLMKEYQIFRDGVLIATTSNTDYLDQGLQAETAYQYTVVAVDLAGNESAPSAELPATTLADGFLPGVVLKKWNGIGGTAISGLTAAQGYPNAPDEIFQIKTMESPVSGDYYGLRMEAHLVPSTTGTHRLAIASDDNGELYLSTDNTDANLQLVASVPGYSSSREYTKYASQISSEIQLEAGVSYRLVALMKENKGGDHLSVAWEGPGIPAWTTIPQANLLVGEDLNPPASPQNFAVSFMTHQFVDLTWSPAADDVGVKEYKLLRDGVLVATTCSNRYRDTGLQAETAYAYELVAVDWSGKESAPAALTATTLPAPPPGSGAGLLAKYYGTMDFHDRLVVRTDPVLNFNWGKGSPDPLLGTDGFSVLWEGQVQPHYSEEYTFYTISDDGVMLWVNGQLLIDNWTNHSATENKGTIVLEAGQKYDIRMHYYERTGSACLSFSWSSRSQLKEIIPQTQLYPAVFVGGTDIHLSTSEQSPVSPAYVEGKCSEEANITFTLNGQASPAGRLNKETWFVDTATALGLSYGVPLDPESPALLDVTADDGTGNPQTVGYTLIWSPTKLNEKSWSSDEMLLRKGDSLLFMVEDDETVDPVAGDDPQVQIEIAAGEATETLTAEIDEKIPHQFNAPAVYTVTAKLRGVEVGTLTVRVLSVDLHVPIAAVLNYERELDVYTEPAGQGNLVEYRAGNETELSVITATVGDTGATLKLKPRVLTDSPLVARLGLNGPMIGYEPVEVFKMDSLNRQIMAFTLEEDDFGTGVLRFRITPRTVIANDKPETPEVEGLFFDLTVRGTGIFFEENGGTKLRVPSTRQDQAGIIAVRVLLSPNGTFTCHDIDAVQVNSAWQKIGDGILNNPPIVTAQPSTVFLQEARECDEVDRTSEQLTVEGFPPIPAQINLYPPDDPIQPNKQKHQVWDQAMQVDSMTIGTYDNELETLVDAFFAATGGNGHPKLLEGPPINRWFTMAIRDPKADTYYGPWAVRLEPSYEFPPLGGAMVVPDNLNQNLDEMVYIQPGNLKWKDDGKPRSYPAQNLPANMFIGPNWAAQECGWITYDTSFMKEYARTYIDITFDKGNMYGNMDSVIRLWASTYNELTWILNPPEERPSGLYSHKIDPLGIRNKWAPDEELEARFPDVVRVGRLEADGWAEEKDEDGYVVNEDKSSRDKFPDVFGANVFEYQVEVPDPTPEDPDHTKTETYVRTMHEGMTGTATPVPVHITLRLAPDEEITAAVTLATKHRYDGTKDGLKTHKAWVSLSETDIFEYRGQDGNTPAQKAEKVYKVIGFNSIEDDSGNSVPDYTNPIFEKDALGNPKTASRVVKFKMKADSTGYADKLVYVYGIEPTVDRMDELKLVVYGEERMGWKAKELETPAHHNQNEELAEDDPYRGGKVIYRWWKTDEEPVNVVKIEFVIPDETYNDGLNPNAERIPTQLVGLCRPTPSIILSGINGSPVHIGSNSATVTMSGTVKDPLADNVPRFAGTVSAGGADIDAVKFYVNGGTEDEYGNRNPDVTHLLDNGDDSGYGFWRQHPYKGTFDDVSVELPLEAGRHVIAVETSKNASGNVGRSSVEVTLEQREIPGCTGIAGAGGTSSGLLALNIYVPATPSSSVIDRLYYFRGYRDVPTDATLLTEASGEEASSVFRGIHGTTPLVITLSEFSGLTEDIDTLTATITFTSIAITHTQVLRFTETAATSKVFRISLGQENQEVLTVSCHLPKQPEVSTTDSVMFFFGARDPLPGDSILSETAEQPQSLVFSGTLADSTGGSAETNLSISNEAFSLTPGIDSFSATLHYRYPSGTEMVFDLTFLETGDESNLFRATVTLGTPAPNPTRSLSIFVPVDLSDDVRDSVHFSLNDGGTGLDAATFLEDEGQEDSKVFVGTVEEDYRWKVSLDLSGFTALTANIDQFDATISVNGAEGVIREFSAHFLETGPQTNHFRAVVPETCPLSPIDPPVHKHWAAKVEVLNAGQSGSYLPVTLRITGRKEVLAQDISINFADTMFDITSHPDGYFYPNSDSHSIATFEPHPTDPDKVRIIYYNPVTKKLYYISVPYSELPIPATAQEKIRNVLVARASTDAIRINLDVWNGGSDLDNGQEDGPQGSEVPSRDKEKIGAYLLVNWDDDDALFHDPTAQGIADPVSDLTQDEVANEDNLAKLQPLLEMRGQLPTRGVVTLTVPKEGSLVQFHTKPTKVTRIAFNDSKQKIWNLANAAERKEFLEFSEDGFWMEGVAASTNERDVLIEISYSLTVSGRAFTLVRDRVRATVVMINLANATYRQNDMPGLSWRCHAALVYSFKGPLTVENLQNPRRYTVCEMSDLDEDDLGTMCDEKRTNREYWGCYTNTNDILNDVAGYTKRLKILRVCWWFMKRWPHTGQYSSNCAMDPKGIGGWDGTLGDIDELRCDGLVEVAYEYNGVMVWGKIEGAGAPHYDIRINEYLDEHNVFHLGDDPNDTGDGWVTLLPITQGGFADAYMKKHYKGRYKGPHRGVYWETTFQPQRLTAPVGLSPERMSSE